MPTVTRHYVGFGEVLEIRILGGQGAGFGANGENFIEFNL